MSLSASVAAIVVTVLSVGGCPGSDPVSPRSDGNGSGTRPASSTRVAGEVIEIRFDEVVAYRDLELRWLEVNDSRCPIGVTCIWEGEVTVTLEAARANEEPVELRLTLHAGSEPQARSVAGYELRLRSVEPHPKHGVTPERSAYLAKIEISEA